MMEYVNTYSVVMLSEENCSMICKNEKVKETIKYIVDKYNVSEEDMECIYSTSLESFLIGGWFEDIESSVDGVIFGEHIEICNEQIIDVFTDCIDEYLPKTDIVNMIKEKKENVFETLYELIEDAGKSLLIDELESMIDKLK